MCNVGPPGCIRCGDCEGKSNACRTRRAMIMKSFGNVGRTLLPNKDYNIS